MVPRVSVILPVRNRAHTVEAAARSVLDQTWRDLELIIVDGASTDGTREVLGRLAAEDARVRVLLNDEAEGVSAARNQGAAEARAPTLAFIDSDDTWRPQKLQRQLEALRGMPRAKIAYTGCRRLFPYGMELRPPSWDEPSDGDLHARFLRHGAINCSTLMVDRASFHEAGGFDETLSFYEDWDLVVRLSAQGPVACAKDWMVDSPQLPDGLSLDRQRHLEALILLAEKHAAMLAAHPRIAEERISEVGWRLLANRRPGAWRWIRRGLAVRPLSLHLPTLRAIDHIVNYKRKAARETPPEGPG
jgi:glycosyltransferase involved in cell wall biosynthesis